MLRFRLANIPVEVAPYFWVGAAIFGSNNAHGKDALLLLAVWVACVFVSILVHELGHALTARHFGLTPTIELHMVGGLTRLLGKGLSRGEGLLVSLGGPGAGLALWLTVRALAPYLFRALGGDAFFDRGSSASLVVLQAVDFLLYINLIWTLFNLLPILPLDGGQVLRELLGPRLLTVTRLIGTACAVGLAVWFALRGSYYTAFFLGYLAFMNFQGNARALPGGTSQT